MRFTTAQRLLAAVGIVALGAGLVTVTNQLTGLPEAWAWQRDGAAQPDASPTAAQASSPEPTVAPGQPMPAPAPQRARAAAPSPRPAPTRHTVTIEGPPPPPPAPLPTAEAAPGCPTYEGTNAPRADVEAALEAAAAKRFWTVSQVALPTDLIKAIAEQESGWQSAIVACDGGIGTMQVMPNTAGWMNQRFGTSYDVHTLTGNTMIGSAYLQWLIKYFGDAYFDGDYTLRAEDCSLDPNVYDHLEPCLLNAVIASYNYGYGAVDDAGSGRIVIPNPQYVENVRALMTRY